jgi:hypothetical protein
MWDFKMGFSPMESLKNSGQLLLFASKYGQMTAVRFFVPVLFYGVFYRPTHHKGRQ